MDFIGMLGSQLGIGGEQAQALAGSVLGGVKGAVAEQLGAESAGKMADAIPELDGWQAQAAKLVGGQSSGGADLLGGLPGMLGGSSGGGGLLDSALGAVAGAQQVSAISGVLTKLGLDGGMAATVAPMVIEFLKSRIDSELLTKILAAVPMPSGLAGGDDGEKSSLGSMLGGLLRTRHEIMHPSRRRSIPRSCVAAPHHRGTMQSKPRLATRASQRRSGHLIS